MELDPAAASHTHQPPPHPAPQPLASPDAANRDRDSASSAAQSTHSAPGHALEPAPLTDELAELPVGDADALIELEEAEVDLADEEGDDEDAQGASKSHDADSSIFVEVKKRLLDDGLAEADANTVAHFLDGVKEEHEAWLAEPGTLERADDEWQQILKELDSRVAKLERRGIKPKLGPMSPTNPLSSFLLDVLYWPHRNVSLVLGYFDRSVPTYRNLAQYRFWETLKPDESGVASAAVVETHWCMDHASSSSDPSFPKKGVFACHDEIQELCQWLVTTILDARLALRTPGLSFGYGAPNREFLGNLFQSSTSITTTTFKRVVESHEVSPREFPVSLICGVDKSKPFSLHYALDHPSSCAYASASGGTRASRSYALSLDRGLEERLLAARLPPAKKSSFFSKMAYVMELRRQVSGEADSTAGARWGQLVNTAYSEELRDRQEHELLHRDREPSFEGVSLAQLVAKFGRRMAYSIEKWAETYHTRADEWAVMPAFHRVPPPTTLLGQAIWATRWHSQLLRRVPRPLAATEAPNLVVANAPSGIPLAAAGIAGFSRGAAITRALSRPLGATEAPNLVVANAPSGVPLATGGRAVIRDQCGDIFAVPRPLPAAEASSIFVGNSPSGLPLASVGEAASSRTTIEVRGVARPMGADEAPGVFIRSAPSGLPLSVPGEEDVARRRAALAHRGRPMATAKSGPFLSNSPSGLPLSTRGGDDSAYGNDGRFFQHAARPLVEGRANAIFLTNSPAGLPLGALGGSVRMKDAFNTSNEGRPMPAPEASSVFMRNTPSGVPVVLQGSSVYGNIRNERDKARSRPEKASEARRLFVANSPSGLPLGITARAGGNDEMVANREAKRPLNGAEAGGIFLANAGSGIPLAVDSYRKQTRTVLVAPTPQQQTDLALDKLRTMQRQLAFDKLIKLTRQQLFSHAIALDLTAAPDDSDKDVAHRFQGFVKQQSWDPNSNKPSIINAILDAVHDVDSADDDDDEDQ